MSSEPGFDLYLKSKKIDSGLFKQAEPHLWADWKKDFDEMHPNSFTIQKLNLINPVRRKYPLKDIPETRSDEGASPGSKVSPSGAAKPGRPVIKPRPKIN